MERWKQNKRFTLIELLIVITILLILFAILLPTLSRTREKTKFVLCTSHLRQMGMGTNMFFQDTDNEKFTGYRNMIKRRWNSHINNVKRGDLYPYVQNTDVYKCPSFESLVYNLPKGRFSTYTLRKSDENFSFSYCF